MKIKKAFRVYFNSRRNWIDVFVSDSPRKFLRREKCYAYYMSAEPRKRRGIFGYIYLRELNKRPDALELVAHELEHFKFDWVLSRRGVMNISTEEKIATFTGDVTRRFWKAYERTIEKDKSK